MGKLTVHLEHDDKCPGDPWWKLYSFNRRHTNFKHPAELGLGPLDAFGDPKVEKRGLARKLKNGTAFILSYFEHGSSLWFLRGDYVPGVEFQWDGRRVAGLLVWDAKLKLGPKKDMKHEARSFLKGYTAWANGEVYRWEITDEQGNYVSSCSGYTAPDFMLKVIADKTRGHEVEFVGDAKWLAQGREQKCEVQKN
jgi:hypothetical protein